MIRDAWCGEERYGHTQGWCYCVEIAALRQQLAAVTQERDVLRLRVTTVDAERAQLAEDRRKMSAEYEAWCLEDV